MIPDKPVTKFVNLNIHHFKDGADFKIFHIVNDVDVSSEESQLQMIDFLDKINRCFDCEETWFKNFFLWELWYPEYHKFVQRGNCLFRPEGLTIF